MKRRELLKTSLAALAGLGLSSTTASRAEADTTTSSERQWCYNGRWTAERANAWYEKQAWPIGYNYVPSTAVNQMDMWQAETFDPETIDRELGMGAAIGMNTARIFMHNFAWEIDRDGFKKRLNTVLDLCEKNKTKALLTFFTNGGPGPHIPIKQGKQPEPTAGKHNPAWLQSPGVAIINDPKQWGIIEEYVKDIIKTFSNDERILCWCLYNEPENERHGEKTLPLLREVWNWAREIDPIHPLTGPMFTLGTNDRRHNLSIVSFLGENCDIISFHCYSSPDTVRKVVGWLQKFERPLICTEYLARPANTFFNVTPFFKENKIGAINFGLVNGKCNFHFPWHPKPEDFPEPRVWFHDIFRKDGSPYDPKEIELIKELTGQK